MKNSSKKPSFRHWLLISLGAGVLLGLITAAGVGIYTALHITNTDYSVAKENGYSGNPSGELLPAVGLQFDASEVVAKVQDSVVTLVAFDSDGSYGFGSGVLFKETDDYFYILTNAHVVNGSAYVLLYLTGAIQPEVEVLGYSMEADAALVRLLKSSVPASATKSFRLATIGDSSGLRKGDFVVTLGTPSEITYRNTVTAGVVSGLNREVSVGGYTRSYLQIDATINPGNSGGALFDEEGNLVGITAAKIISSNIEGISFALPINEFMEIINTYMP